MDFEFQEERVDSAIVQCVLYMLFSEKKCIQFENKTTTL